MWQLLLRAWGVRGFRYLVFPLSLCVGLMGSQLEGYFHAEKARQDNRDFPSAWDRRNARQLEEMDVGGAGGGASSKAAAKSD